MLVALLVVHLIGSLLTCSHERGASSAQRPRLSLHDRKYRVDLKRSSPLSSQNILIVFFCEHGCDRLHSFHREDLRPNQAKHAFGAIVTGVNRPKSLIGA